MFDDILGPKDIIELKLSFKLGERVNGRLYKPSDLKKAFNKKIKESNGIFVISEAPQRGRIPMDKIVGLAKDYDVESDGTVVFDVKKMVKDDFLNDDDVLILNCMGTVDEKKVVSNLRLICFSVIR